MNDTPEWVKRWAGVFAAVIVGAATLAAAIIVVAVAVDIARIITR